MSLTTRKNAARRAAAIAVLLGVLGVVAVAASGAPAPPTPTITSGPTNPTSSTSATFNYSDSQSGVTFECRLDAAAFAVCPGTTSGTKAYPGPLALGSHTFQVQAVSGGKTSSAASFTWVVNAAPPTVVSLVRVGSSPTNAASVSWTVTFSTSVTGVDPTDFALVKTGIAGASSTVSLSGSGTAYTATMASTGTGDGTVGLNVVDDDTIMDGAARRLGGTGTGNGNFTGPVYGIDETGPLNAPTINSGPAGYVSSTSATFAFSSSESGAAGFQCSLNGGSFVSCSSSTSYSGLAQGARSFAVRGVDAVGNAGPAATRAWTVDTVPPAIQFTQTPPDPDSSATAHFAWTQLPADPNFDHYECSKENGAFVAAGCASPFVVDTSNNGQHQFAVRAVDKAANGTQISYTWKVEKGSIQDFTISGNAQGTLYPGGASGPINLLFNNPNSVAVIVTSLTVTKLSLNAPNATIAHPCTLSDFAVTQFSGAYGFTIPVGASSLQSVGFTLGSGTWPTVRVLETGLNQDGCKGATITLSYTGSAHS
jgi:hypothetical protein